MFKLDNVLCLDSIIREGWNLDSIWQNSYPSFLTWFLSRFHDFWVRVHISFKFYKLISCIFLVKTAFKPCFINFITDTMITIIIVVYYSSRMIPHFSFFPFPRLKGLIAKLIPLFSPPILNVFLHPPSHKIFWTF